MVKLAKCKGDQCCTSISANITFVGLHHVERSSRRYHRSRGKSWLNANAVV